MDFSDNTRPPAVSGMFYPGDKNDLSVMIDGFLDNAEMIENKGNLKALIVPHAGYIFSGVTAAWGYKQLQNMRVYHFLVTGPSHQTYFEGLAVSGAKFWQTPLGKVKHLTPVKSGGQFELYKSAHLKEHSVEVQIPFIQKVSPDTKITCVLTGDGINHKMAAEYYLKNFPKTFFIFSSDLSHYLHLAQAKIKDDKTITNILNLNSDPMLIEENTACGRDGIAILIEMAKIKKWQPKLLHYDTSKTASGDSAHVVGYASIGFYENT